MEPVLGQEEVVSQERPARLAKQPVAKPAAKPPAKPASKQASLSKAAASSHKVTEYFSVRRSERRPRKKSSPDELDPAVEEALGADRDDVADVEIRDFPEKGRGVVAARDFARGEFVVEYAGDLIDVCMAKKRESDYALDLSKGCYMYYFKSKGKQYW